VSLNPNLFLSIGKPIKDEYGRTVGRIASFSMTPNGKFDAVFVEFSSGKFSKQPLEQMKFNGSEVTFISTTKSQAIALCDQIPLIWRKDQALKDLSEKKKITPEMYAEIHKSFDGILTQLKKDAQVISDELADQIGTCEDEVKALSYAILNLELEHEIGRVEEEAYKTAFGMLQENLKRITAEKNELELAKNKLSNTLLGDAIAPATNAPAPKPNKPAESQIEPSSSQLPEPPVVVYVKEVGKAGM
jgi:hypothetical protein